MAYASAPQLPKASKRHPRVCQPESIDKPPTKNPIKVCSARAKHAIFRAASRVSWWQEAGGGEGRRHTQPHRQKAHTRQGRRHAGMHRGNVTTICPAICPPQHTHNLPSTILPMHTESQTPSPNWLPHHASPHMDLLILSQSLWICSFIPNGIEVHGLIAWKVSPELLHKLLGEQLILLL